MTLAIPPFSSRPFSAKTLEAPRENCDGDKVHSSGGAGIRGVVVFLHPLLAAELMRLAGPWRFALDCDDAGVRDGWFNKDLADRIHLPGTLPGQGIGDEVTSDTKWSGSIQDTSYRNESYFMRWSLCLIVSRGISTVPSGCSPASITWVPRGFSAMFEIPAGWQGRRVVLTLERPHWELVPGRTAGFWARK